MVVSRTIIGVFDYHNFKYHFIVMGVYFYLMVIFLINYVDIPGREAIFLC